MKSHHGNRSFFGVRDELVIRRVGEAASPK